MSSGNFGGWIKLRGEAEYRTALQNIRQSLRETGSALTNIKTNFENSDKSMQSAESAVKRLNSVLKEQKSQYDKLKSTYDTMDTKYKENQKSLDNLKAKYDEAKSKLDTIKNTLGENSAAYENQKKKVENLSVEVSQATYLQEANKRAMSDLATQMNKSETAISQTKSEISKLNTEMDKSQREAKESDSAYGTLKNTISQQESKLQSLKTQYSNVVLEQGKNSKSAKDLAKDIDSLSGELQENKTKMSDAESAADKLDKSLDNVSESAKKTANGGFTVLKGVLSDLISNGIQRLASAIKDQLGSAIARVDTINAYKQTMENLGYATEDVTKTTDALKSGIEGLPTTLPNIMSMQQQYAALGYSIDEATDLTLALNNATLAGGQGQEVANSALDQWYQILAAGKPDLQSWRIITGAMPAQLNQIAEETMGAGKKSQDLFEAWKKGTVTTDQIKDALIKLNKEGGGNLSSFEEQAKDSTGGVQTSMDNVKTAISNALANIIESIGQSNIADFFNNLKPIIKQVGDTMAEMVKKIDWKAFGKAVSDALELALKGFIWIIDNHQVVITALGLIVAAFAIKKVIEWGTAIKDGIGLVKNLTTALSGLTTGGVIGLISIAVSGLAALFSAFASSANKDVDSVTKRMEKLNEEMKDRQESWDALTESSKKAIDAGLGELSYYEKLWQELQNIVDQNGKVKEGYEERASFITSTLSNAFGVEIQDINGVIQQYGNLKQSIEDVIQQKKAQIILDNQETKYKEALQNEDAAAAALGEQYKNLTSKKFLLDQADKDLTEAKKKRDEAQDIVTWKYYDSQVQFFEGIQKERKKDADNAQTAYDQQLNQTKQYQFYKDQYEENMVKAHEGRVEEMTNLDWEDVKEFMKAGGTKEAILKASIKKQEEQLDDWKNAVDENGKCINQDAVNKGEERLRDLERQLQEYESTTDKGLEKTTITWSDNLDDQLSEITGRDIKFEDAGDGNVQMYIDGVKSGEPKSKQEMADLVTNTINEISKQETDAEDAGKDLIDGINNGIGNTRKQQGVFGTIGSFADKIIEKFKSTLGIASPSKVTKKVGQFLLEGLSLGLEDEENLVLKQMSNFAQNLVTRLEDKLSVGKGLAENFGDNFSNSMKNIDIDMNRYIPSKIGTNLSIDMQSAQNAPYNLQNSLDNNSGRFVINIENFVNNREQDVQAFAKELEFYSRRNSLALG